MKITILLALSFFISSSIFAQKVNIDLSTPEKAFESYINVCEKGTEEDLKEVYLSQNQFKTHSPSENYCYKPIKTLRSYYKLYDNTTKKPKVNRVSKTEKTVTCEEANKMRGITVRFIKVEGKWFAYDSRSWHKGEAMK